MPNARIGDKLPNGGVIIAIKYATPWYEDNTLISPAVVLCLLPENEPHKLVSWQMDLGRWNSTTSGHYYADIFEAAAAFKERY